MVKTIAEKYDIADLEQEKKNIERQIREKKRLDACLELESAVKEINEDTASARARIIKACYGYIANHRKMG